jgi:hypothetical protein
MVDLLLRALHPMGQPLDHVLRVLAENLADVIKPWSGLRGVAGYDHWRAIKVETGHALSLNPPALQNEAITD